MGKLFNNNNLRVSYSCTRNVQALITANNRRLLNSACRVEPVKRCNCHKARPYSPTARKCALCTAEKVYIAKGDEVRDLEQVSPPEQALVGFCARQGIALTERGLTVKFQVVTMGL